MKNWLQSLAAIGVLTGAMLVGGCADRDTPDYQARVNDDLKAARLDEVRADWQRDEKTLHLRGEVERTADKARAEDLAKQVVGTSGRVINEVTVEGTNAEAVDDRIEARLDRIFKEHDEWDKDKLDLTFESTLAGADGRGAGGTRSRSPRSREQIRDPQRHDDLCVIRKRSFIPRGDGPASTGSVEKERWRRGA